jgi:hypothetical protein
MCRRSHSREAHCQFCYYSDNGRCLLFVERGNDLRRQNIFDAALLFFLHRALLLFSKHMVHYVQNRKYPFRHCAGWFEFENVNKSIDFRFGERQFFTLRTGKPGRKMSVVCEVACLPKGECRVHTCGQNQRCPIGQQRTTVVGGIIPCLLSVPLQF